MCLIVVKGAEFGGMTYDTFGRILGQDRSHEGYQGEGEDGELHFSSGFSFGPAFEC